MLKYTTATLLVAATFLLLCGAPVFGQAVSNAQIQGLVTDATGASVPGVAVKATQTDTGQVRSTVSNTDGSYVLPNLAVGPYKLEAGANGFKTYVQSGLILQVGNNVQINISLQLGAVSQQMEVSADATMVQTQDTSVSQVIDQRRIVDLPLNGRQATDLILLSGGAAMPPNSSRVITTHDYVNAVGISVAGGQINGNNYLLDGGDHNDSHSNVNMPFPFPDALQEFSVETSGVSSRYGVHPGSVVNVVTKSGSNQIHGNLFEFVRNGDFNARNFFAPTQDTLRRNQFGGTVGAPILKEKLFIFSGFQSTRIRTAVPSSIAFVNTQSTLNGDFSTVESAACQSSNKAVTLTDPTTNQPFPNNAIPVSRFSTPSLNLIKAIPTSTDPCGRVVYSIPNPNDENQYIGRVDWVKSTRHSIYGRYFIADLNNPPIYAGSLLTTTRSGLEERTQSVVVGDQFSITPRMVNSLHLTYARLAINRGPSPEMPSPVGLGVNMYNSYAHFTDLSVTNHFTVGGGSNAPAYYMRDQYHLSDDFDMVRGRHHLSYGVELLQYRMLTRNVSLSNGEFSFSGILTNDALADFMIGRPNSLADANPDEGAERQWYAGAYVQDDLHLAKNLNIHVGMRWEPFLPEHDVAGRGNSFSLAGFLAGQKTGVYANAPVGLFFHGDSGIPAAYANRRWNGFAPRVGLAWDPTGSGKTSIRSSYGIFYDTPQSYLATPFSQDAPWGNQITLAAPAGGFANPFVGYPGGNPFPTPYPPSHNSIFPQQAAYVNMPLNLRHMYMQQWDLAVEHQFARNWLVSATYLGNKATHVFSSEDANPAIYGPGATAGNANQRRLLYRLNSTQGAYYAAITTLDDGDNTSYNALRLSVQHRFANHFTLLSVYTYSHCLQDAESIPNKLTGNQYQNPFNRNADHGSCDFDLRQNLVNSFVYEMPKFGSRAVNAVAGNWQIGFLITARTGFPFSPLTGVDASLTSVGQDRPNVTGDPYVRDRSTLVWVKPGAFTANAAGTYGNAGANSLFGPGSLGWDTNLTKVFRITERQRVDLRFEFFNLLNHTNFANPVNNLRSSTFGLVQASADPRLLQFALKYSF
jgi:hypothetical protein